MYLPRFQYHAPQTLEEACGILKEYGPIASPLAGGTDVLVKMKMRHIKFDHLVSLTGLSDLTAEHIESERLRLGPCRTISDIARSLEIRSFYPALAESAENLGGPAIRNVATIGGNLITASPAADIPPVLMAYGAYVYLRSERGLRNLNLEQFFKGPGLTNMHPDEIMTDIHVQRPAIYSGAAFFKLGNRMALQISIVNGASYIQLDPNSGEVVRVRIVLGAVAPVPLRCRRAEEALLGRKPNEKILQEAGEAAAKECRPIDDLRGTAAYRRDMAGAITRRTLRTALGRARQNVKEG